MKLPKNKVQESLARNIQEFAPGMTDMVFAEKLLYQVIEKKADLDTIIEKAAPDWPLEKINNVDRNVLRLGLSELLFSERSQVPPKVAINEAIELAKTFGGDTSGKFVNGVLGAVYKELGEPGKDEESPKGKKGLKNSASYEDIPLERLAGAIIFARDNDVVRLALVHNVFGHWTLSKGHVEEGEEEEIGVKRVIKEELGISIRPIEKVGENEYVAFDPEKGKLRKRVSYFLAESEFEELVLPPDKGGLDDVRWFTVQDIADLNFYDDVLPLMTKAVTLLSQYLGRK